MRTRWSPHSLTKVWGLNSIDPQQRYIFKPDPDLKLFWNGYHYPALTRDHWLGHQQKDLVFKWCLYLSGRSTSAVSRGKPVCYVETKLRSNNSNDPEYKMKIQYNMRTIRFNCVYFYLFFIFSGMTAPSTTWCSFLCSWPKSASASSKASASPGGECGKRRKHCLFQIVWRAHNAHSIKKFEYWNWSFLYVLKFFHWNHFFYVWSFKSNSLEGFKHISQVQKASVSVSLEPVKCNSSALVTVKVLTYVFAHF